MGRSIGLDVHRDFCEVAIADGCRARSAGRVATNPEQLELFARSLAPTDRVGLEATGNALTIARFLEPHVAEVVLAHAKDVRAISHARVKTDKIDARVLADLLAAGLIPQVWIGEQRCRMLLRLVSRRRALVKRRTQVKNEVSAVLHRNLKGRNPATDPFSGKGRAWMLDQRLPVDERLTLEAGLRQLDFLGAELAQIDRVVAGPVVDDHDVRRLLRIPGVDVVTASTLMAVIGDMRRFPTARHVVGYLSLHPSVRQSGSQTARHGRVSKQGPAAARHVLVEAAWAAAKSPRTAARLRAADRRGSRPPGRHGCRRAQAAVLAWHLLTHGEDYAFQRPSLVRRKLRALELAAGAPRAKPGPNKRPVWGSATNDLAERQIAQHAENAYRRFVADWHATARRWVRARHRSAHLEGPRGARPRGRPQAPDACSSPRQSPAPNRSLPQAARTRQPV